MPQYPSHLERRGASFRWRRRLPSRLLAKNVAPCIGVALRTHLVPEARARARRLDQLSELVFALMESADVLGEGLDERIITELARFEIAAADATRARAPARSRLDAELAFQREAAYREVLRDAYLLRDREVAREPIRAACARLGVSVAEDTDDWRALADSVTRALIEVSEIRERRDRGLFETPLPAVTAAARGIDAAPRGHHAPALASDRHHRQPMRAPAQAEPAIIPSATMTGLSSPVSATAASAPASLAMARPEHPAMPSPHAIRDIDDEPPAEHHATGAAAAHPHHPAVPAANTAELIASRDRAIEAPDLAAMASASSNRTYRAPLAAPVTQPVQHTPSPGRRGMTVSEAFDFYIDGKQRGRVTFHPLETASRKKGASWTRHSLSNAKAAKTILLGLVGDLPVDDIPPERLSQALDMLERLPDNWGKSEVERRRKTIVEVVNDADRRDERVLAKLRARLDAGTVSPGNFEVLSATLMARRISVNTRIKHMREFNRVFKAARASGLINTNPMEGRLLPQSVIDELLVQEEDRSRKPWGAKLPVLYTTPLYTEPLEDLGDPLFWATIIAPRAGLRSEEIYQLGPDDIQQEGGILFFNITNGPGQHLKSKAARRRVPIHSEIIALGFLELVALRRRQGEHRLFPNLKRGACTETFTAIMSKRFGHYRRRHGLYDRTRDFHSFRTGFNVDLIDARVDGTIRRALMGHEETDVGILHYAPGGHPLHVLQEAVEQIRIGVAGIRHPFGGDASRSALPLRLVR